MHCRLLAASLLLFLVAGCGGGADDGPTQRDAQARQRIASAVGALPAQANASEATQLFDFAEANYPQFFPSHQPDRSVDTWRYRFYPQTGISLVVADAKVYVFGGPFGEQALYVGKAHDLLNPPPNAIAAVSTPATAKTAWNVATPAQFTMTDTAGLAVGGPFTCSSDAAVALEVAADCSTVKGLRLGVQTITVSKGGLVAKATIKVIPQPQPLGTNMRAGYNLVATPDGRVLAWGENSGGALGQGQFSSQLASLLLPTAVKSATGSGALAGIVAVSAGETTALALSEDGEVHSWGNGDALGRTNHNGDARPGRVLDPTGNAPLKHIVAVAVGDDNALALADDGTVFAWGSYTGINGSTTMKFPVSVSLPGKAVAIAAGWNWSAVLLADGRVTSWGYESAGAGNTGHGYVISSGAPAYVLDRATAQPLEGVVAVSAGYLHGMALTSSGQVYSWGRNSWGALGLGNDRSNQSAAAKVHSPTDEWAWVGLNAVAAGGNFSLALDAAGKVFSWGYAQNGELGDGVNHPRVNESGLPAAVVNAAGFGQLSDIVAIAGGYEHGLALAADGRLLAWGSGSSGRLGQGGSNTALSYVPLVVKNEAGTAPLNLGPVSYWPNLARRGLF
ncbi:hypothetical protein HLB44_03510 [Aquincola sp. S2]|uniref:Alpha-tubulin suppressor n=1 Tax=Pseudaquabacterium terrae TaxID=2732868 RepID=A0ABX2EAE0_9BURK|nr:hypothetical protein [Aquabacterium terrae]NRF66051.1 hypothetical protein [Aquabacterium terrae]